MVHPIVVSKGRKYWRSAREIEKLRAGRRPFKDGRWDWSLEGTTCPTCGGEGQYLTTQDAHRSAGWVPCPRRGFQGHGRPTCTDGVLRFSEYDRKNEDKLREAQRKGHL